MNIRERNRGLGNSHQILKEFFASILEDRGFSVKIEKRIYTPEDTAPIIDIYYDPPIKRSWFSVDVYGERDGEIIMYEVGHCERNKLDWLRRYIGRVIHMPFLTQWIPGFYYRPRNRHVLTDEERMWITRRLSKRKW